MSFLSSRIAQRLYSQKFLYFPSLGAAVAVTPVWFSITADLHMKQLSYAIEQSFLDYADCNFSSSQNDYVYEFGIESFTYSFGLLPLVLPKPLSTSTFFYWTLFMLLYSLLPTTLTWYFASPIPFSPLAVCSTWVYLLAIIGGAGVTAQVRTV